MNKMVSELLQAWKMYSSDRDVLLNPNIPDGQPVLSFEGFIEWLKKECFCSCHDRGAGACTRCVDDCYRWQQIIQAAIENNLSK